MPQQTMHKRQAVVAVAHPPLQKRLSLLVSVALLGSLPFGITLAADGIQDLGVLGSGDFSISNAVNADGSVVVGESTTSGSNNPHAFRWVNGIMTDLGTLGGSDSFAAAVNADGSMAASSWETPILAVAHTLSAGWRATAAATVVVS